MTTDTFRELALSMPGSYEAPHFEKRAFRTKKRIFATLDVSNGIACLKLSPVDQSVFTSVNKPAITPVPNKWGLKGWTFFDLKKTRKNIMIDAITTAYFKSIEK
ncbi:MAG: MmcQ/YjbR family DNA-binding protein [Ignavibacteria bacterium]|nr:MmcQ/YjbR family DNA-binding protein [Ignavibacteria bacterium]